MQKIQCYRRRRRYAEDSDIHRLHHEDPATLHPCFTTQYPQGEHLGVRTLLQFVLFEICLSDFASRILNCGPLLPKPDVLQTRPLRP
ncbi:hypothetical protein CDAR_415101 [Caerostris darwini]|uniref:Uncharacterized protein n=1 Tax=Caerostris darwini TaxID=1538125 RepID=A0AAV4TJR9_9ARAC|nr:hypothetical protein CDAR_415101 [Caerostris darwini]